MLLEFPSASRSSIHDYMPTHATHCHCCFCVATPCVDPRCYVDAGCPTASATRLFNGSLLHYSYDTCGRTPDCYNNFESESRCPYDPHGTGNYLIFKSNGCECLYHGSELPESLYANLPPVPGQYESLGEKRLVLFYFIFWYFRLCPVIFICGEVIYIV